MIKYQFIPAGSKAILKENNLYLDVGNSLEYGIIDHHQLNTQKSATTLVYENPNFIPPTTKTILLHKSVDLDCVASSYLANYYLKNQTFPKFTKSLCKFVNKIDFGIKPNSTINLNSIFSIMKNEIDDDYKTTLQAHKLIEELSIYGFDTDKLPSKYDTYKNIINKDIKLFTKDLEISKKIEVNLKTRNNRYKPTKGLILFAPKSMFFKYFARDYGYDLLIVKWSDKRIVISLKPDSFFTLKEIAQKLNKAEKEKRKKLNIIINEENRNGYDMPNPWYDGRGHNYTIIDSPYNGSLLDFEEILRICKLRYLV